MVQYPSFLVLDGLDEVPASSNRTQVLDAVREFAVDIVSGRVDMFILATTRPQGYNPDYFGKHACMNLSKSATRGIGSSS